MTPIHGRIDNQSFRRYRRNQPGYGLFRRRNYVAGNTTGSEFARCGSVGPQRLLIFFSEGSWRSSFWRFLTRGALGFGVFALGCLLSSFLAGFVALRQYSLGVERLGLVLCR